MKRKASFILVLTFMLLLSQAVTLPVASVYAKEDATHKSVTLTEGTNLDVAVSPDGQSIVMDLQGVLWMLSSDGKGKRITEDFDDVAFPQWSPDGKKIIYQSYTDGNYHIGTMSPTGEDKNLLTSGMYDYREPTYSPDGKQIAFASDRGGKYDIWTMDLESEELTQWTNSKDEEYQPAWSPDGKNIAFVRGNNIESIDVSGNREVLATSEAGVEFPAWSPDGKDISYYSEGTMMISGKQITKDEDVFPFPAKWVSTNEVIYTADGQIKKRNLEKDTQETIPFVVQIDIEVPDYKYKKHDFDSEKEQPVKGIVAPKISPDGKKVVFVALNDLWVWDIEGGDPVPLTDDVYLEMAPTWSPDGKQIAYSSDKAGTEDIYILDLESKKEQQLTSVSDRADKNVDWSPDGTHLAFQDQSGFTYTIDIKSGKVEAVTEALTFPGPPTWSADSQTIALTAVQTFSNRFREGTNQILTVNVKTKEQLYEAPIADAPDKSISNRANSGPAWSPDGKYMAYEVESQLYITPVDQNGKISGDPKLVSEDIAESPSWSGDSSKILYLSNGDMKIVSIKDGSKPKTLPFDMKWQPVQPKGKTVIHASGLWDGISKELQEDVDIILNGNRVEDVVPHNQNHHDQADKFIDASGLTVMPGMWDTHIHQQGARYTLGFGSRVGRQLLAFGITSTISMGDVAYQAIEESESLRSGNTVGPRFFKTGGLLEGSRVYYDAMRPTTSMEALDRELERVKPFDYDLIKTYVRLPNDQQAHVIKFAHDLGIPTFSHYFYPSMAFGQDGASHITATQRGFSRTVSPGGNAYDDVIKLAGASGMSITTTLFDSSLLAYYPELFQTDTRLKTLLTPWQYESMKKGYDASSKEHSEAAAKDVAILQKILDAGGTVIAGTDTPIDYAAVPLHLNLKGMTKYGMSNYDALRTSTYYPAVKMGVEDELGTIEKGKLADFVFVKGNPLEDVKNAANISMVMKNGESYTMDELMKPFADDTDEPKPEKEEVFADVTKNNSHYDGIMHWYENDKITGYPAEDGGKRTYQPSKGLSRSHAALLLSRIEELKTPANVDSILKNYKDVTKKTMYSKEIAATYEAGFFKGSNGYFLGDNNLTREQMATVLVNVYDLKKSATSKKISLTGVSPSHKESVQILADNGLTDQLNNYRPREATTRGQFATLLYRIDESK